MGSHGPLSVQVRPPQPQRSKETGVTKAAEPRACRFSCLILLG